MNISEQCKITRVSASAVAATTDVNSSSVDMTGFDGVAFLVAMGAITAGAATSIKLQQSSDDGVADGWSDLAGTSVTVPDDGGDSLFYIEARCPLKRYVRCVVDRGTQNAVLDAIIAIRTNAKTVPVVQTITGELHHAPAES